MASDTGGVKPFSIAGRMVRERERTLGMTDEERAWRAQWLKDQELAPEEPIITKEYYRARINPIRRIYRAPLDKLGEMLVPALGESKAAYTRFYIGKFALGIAFIYSAFYYFKYNQNTWHRKGGWRVTQSRMACYPGDPGYPDTGSRSKPNHYAARGFNEAEI